MIKRVLLVNPPETRPPDLLADKVRIGVVAPLGLAYIAAVLEQHGIEVKILDCLAEHQNASIYAQETRYGLSDSEITQSLNSYAPDIVGVSCLFSNKAFDAHNICRIAKEVNPTIITVMGGAHPTAMGCEGDSKVDRAVHGDGEYEMLAMVRGEINYHGRPLLDGLPFPARHLLNMPKYLYSESSHSGLKRTPMATMSTSRGCPSRCEFCAIRGTFGDAFRVRSPENVLAEIDHLVSTYGMREIHFEDDNLTANKRRAMAIFQGIIDRKYDLSLNSPSGLAVFAMDEELLDKMRGAGYYSISLAIESGVSEVLKLMHKNVDLVKAKRLVKYARSIGLKVKAFFILGYPGETVATMQRTVEYAGALGADWSLFFPATPLPGTYMDKRVRANGWLVDPDMDYRYYFHRPNIRTPKFGPDDVLRIREDANCELNFEHNVNMSERKYDRATEDFREVVRMYPHLDFAQAALARAQYAQEKKMEAMIVKLS